MKMRDRILQQKNGQTPEATSPAAPKKAKESHRVKKPSPVVGALNRLGAFRRPKEAVPSSPPARPAEPDTSRADEGNGEAEPHRRAEPQVESAHRERIGWVSPSYTQTRFVAMDPETANRNRCVAFRPESAEADAYRVVRARLTQRMRERGGNTVMITSALPGEGKTLTSINLALTFAKEFHQTVLLVDCDLKRQKIHQDLGYRSERGLIDYLVNDVPVSELMVCPGIEKMVVISGGRTIGDSSELLGTLRMKELVDDMRNRYPDRIVLFDVPPILAGADVLAFAPLVDHILVTVQAGTTQLPEIRSALAMLPAEKVAGLVLNRQEAPELAYYPAAR